MQQATISPATQTTDIPHPNGPTLALRPYQEDALRAIEAAAGAGITRQLVALPTGAGKTVVFAHLARRRGGRTLILAHRDELIRQAADKVRLVDPTARIGVVKAEHDEHDRPVVIASVQTLTHPRRLARLTTPYDTIIVDEAHHAAAASYRAILEHCGTFGPSGPLTVGFTATPDRGDGVGLDNVFGRIVFDRTILELMEDGYLCDLRALRVLLDADLGGLHSRGGDFVAAESAAALLDADAPAHIVAAYLEHAADRKALVFTPTVAVAEAVAAAFRETGVAAEALDGTTPTGERRAILARFHGGETRVVANCAVLTEGFDEPTVDCIVIARPTRSRGLYQQMIGRGTRRAPGKGDCLILDVVGATNRHDLVTTASLFGLPPQAATDQTVLGVIAEQRAIVAGRLEAEAAQGRIVAQTVDLFRRSPAVWTPTAGQRYVLPFGTATLTLAPGGDGWMVLRQERGAPPETLAAGLDLGYAQGFAEDVVRRAGLTVLVDAAAPWRRDPATERQLATLRKLRLPISPVMTKGAAQQAIAAAVASWGTR